MAQGVKVNTSGEDIDIAAVDEVFVGSAGL